MAAKGVLVFDDGSSTTVEGGSEQAFVILDEGQDVLVLDSQPVREIVESDSSTDFIIFDSRTTITETLVAPADFVLIDPPKQEARVVLDGDPLQDVYVLTPGGPPGPPGPTGQQGSQGQSGTPGPGAYLAEFNFASPATTWTVVHNQNSLGMNVETFDTNGDPIEGFVRFIDANTVEIDWYYPTAGLARLFK